MATNDDDMMNAINANAVSIDITWNILCGALVFFMQAGFAMLEAGSVSSKNALNILFKNVCDACISAIGFWLVGYGVAFGLSKNGFIGTSDYALRGPGFSPDGGIDDGDVPALYFQWWFFQWAFAATAATIVSGSVAERCKLDAYYIYSAVVTVFIYPVVVCWCWGYGWLSPFNGDPANFQFEGKDSYNFIDFAGSGVVHMTGGILGLVAAIIIGPRSGRFNQDGSVNEMPGHNMTIALLGVLILWFGWYGFNCGSTAAMSGTAAYVAGKVAVTTTIAAATAGLTQILYQKFFLGTQDLGKVGNAILAGLVSITAPCATVDVWAAFMIGMIGCIFYNLASMALLKLNIDDPLDASPIHGGCGLWGVLAVGIFSTDKNAIFAGYNADATNDDQDRDGPLASGEQFGVQIIGALAIIGWVSVTGTILFMALHHTIGLRVDPDMEESGLDSSEHGGRAYNHHGPVATSPVDDGGPDKKVDSGSAASP